MNGTGLLLLDTNVVLHLVRGKATGNALDTAYGLISRPDRPMISIVTVGELLSFAKRLAWGAAKVDRLIKLTEELVVVDIRSRAVLASYADVHAYLVRSGRPIGDNDMWIAATAMASNAVLLTADKDFDPLHGTLLTRIYFDPRVAIA